MEVDLFLAYLDPGTGSLILQAVVSSIFAGLVFFRQAIGRIFGRFLPRKTAPKSESNSDES